MKNKNNQNEQQWQLLVLLLKEIAESKGITQNEIAEKTKGYFSEISKLGESQASILSDSSILFKENSLPKQKKDKKLPTQTYNENQNKDEL